MSSIISGFGYFISNFKTYWLPSIRPFYQAQVDYPSANAGHCYLFSCFYIIFFAIFAVKLFFALLTRFKERD